MSLCRRPSPPPASPCPPAPPPSSTARASSASRTARRPTVSSGTPRSTTILSVIDSTHAGIDAGHGPRRRAERHPRAGRPGRGHRPRRPRARLPHLRHGARRRPALRRPQRVVLLDGIARGMHIINGLHEFLNDDAEFVAAAPAGRRDDHRRPPPQGQEGPQAVLRPHLRRHLPAHRGARHRRRHRQAHHRHAPRPGAQRPRRSRPSWSAPARPTLIQGGKYGVALDALVPQFCSGEVEAQVVAAFEGEDPDVIVVEGQGALSHPAYLTSAHILRGSRPAGVIVQHAPKRRGPRRLPDGADAHRGQRDQPDRGVRRHQGHRHHHQPRAHDRRPRSPRRSTQYELELGLPATDPLTRPLDRLVDMVLARLPRL